MQVFYLSGCVGRGLKLPTSSFIVLPVPVGIRSYLSIWSRQALAEFYSRLP